MLHDKFLFYLTDDLNPAQIQILDLDKDSVHFKWGGTDAGAATQYEISLIEVNNATAVPHTADVALTASPLEYRFYQLEPGTLYNLQVSVDGTLESGTERFRTSKFHKVG